MSALSPEARARLEAWLARYQSCADSEHMRIPGDDSPWGPTFGDLRAMLADSDALAASEAADRAVVVAMEAAKAALETVTRERDEARRKFDSLIAMTESGQSFAAWDAHVRERAELERLRAQDAKLREALSFYADGDVCCVAMAPCAHPRCEFPACAKKQFPVWDRGDVARAALRATAPEPREDGGSDE